MVGFAAAPLPVRIEGKQPPEQTDSVSRKPTDPSITIGESNNFIRRWKDRFKQKRKGSHGKKGLNKPGERPFETEYRNQARNSLIQPQNKRREDR